MTNSRRQSSRDLRVRTGAATRKCEAKIKEETKATLRCIPLEQPGGDGNVHFLREGRERKGHIRSGVLRRSCVSPHKNAGWQPFEAQDEPALREARRRQSTCSLGFPLLHTSNTYRL